MYCIKKRQNAVENCHSVSIVPLTSPSINIWRREAPAKDVINMKYQKYRIAFSSAFARLLEEPSKKARALNICGKMEKKADCTYPEEMPASVLKKKLSGS